MSFFSLIRPALFAFDAESAHRLTLRLTRLLPEASAPAPCPILSSTVAGICFPNPVGLAAGFDKEGEVVTQMFRFGFGFVEAGTLTPLPQGGNPTPRLFRLVDDKAVINRMGFNNGGQQAARPRFAAARGGGRIIGVNIGANKDAVDRIADYAVGVQQMAGVASYLTINISSPNTPGLRNLQSGDALDALLDGISAAKPANCPPVFLKVAPDLEPAEIDAVARLAMGRVDALIVSNTTISRPPLRSVHAGEAGGLSGAPLHDLALQRLRDFRGATGGALPLIGAGGISNAEQAYARIRAGASLIQLYSALVYEGPWLAQRINTQLKALLARDGLNNIAEAVGADAS